MMIEYLNSLVCKALWNYCDNNYEKDANQPLWFNEQQLRILFSLFDETLRKNLIRLKYSICSFDLIR